MLNNDFFKKGNKLIDNSAFKRVAEPIEIANVALFLASDISEFTTGVELNIDGGQSL